ncbi:T9SS type A sorting domain-containing protein [Pollutibacter soli]|uniref:T9SS type A sorting domain-containing protein n=1 Tax=Pollutibacter soli TaxID=3034157 RepID=UPI003013B2D3
MFPKLPAYKNLTLTFVALMSLQIAIAQTNLWDGSADNNWNNPANWSLNVVPVAKSNVVIPINANIVVNVALPVFKSLTISNNSTVVLNALTTNRTISLQNTGLALNIQSGSTLTLQGTTTEFFMIRYIGTASTAIIAGTLNLGTAGAGGGYGASNAVTTVTGKMSLLKGRISTTVETELIFGDGGIYEHHITGGFIPAATWDANSLVDLIGTIADLPTGFNQVFGNLAFHNTLTRPVFLNSDIFAQSNFTVNNSGPYIMGLTNHTAPSAMIVGGNFVMNSGIFALVQNASDGSLDVGGNLIVNGGTFDAKRFSGAANINVFGNLEINGGVFNLRAVNGNGSTSTLSVFTNYIQTAGTLNLNSVINSSTVFNLYGDFMLNGGTLTESGAGTSNGQIFFGGFIQNYHKGGTTPASAIINYTVNEGSVLQFADNSTISGAGTFTNLINSTIGVKHPQGISTTGATGQIQVTGTRTYAAGANYIYNGTANQVTGTGLTQNTIAFLTIDNPGNTVTLSAPTEVSADLVINAGNFNLNNNNLTLGGEYYNNDVITPGTAKVILNGAGIQTLGGNVSSTFYILELAKTSGSVLLGIDQFVSNTLNIDVILDLGTFNLTMGNTAQAIGTLTGTFDETKMIVSTGGGQLRKSATNAAQATYGFPIGDIDGTPEFSPAGILFSGGSYNGWVGVTVVNQKHPNNGNNTDYLNRYWTVDQNGFSGFTATVGFNFVPADVVGTETEVRLGQWEGNEPWVRYDPSLIDPQNLLTATVTQFSDFTGLSVSEALPIHFGSIRGWAVNNNSIAVEWKILGETGTSHYEVEKLVSANNFAKIGSQNASNSGLDETYTFTDVNPASGDNFYRIKGIELTGEITYSPVVKVKLNGSSAREMKIYPNPIRNSNLAISLQNFKSGKYDVVISNNNGQIIHNSKINQVGPNTIVNIQLNPTLSKGIYRLRITNGEDTYLSSFAKE